MAASVSLWQASWSSLRETWLGPVIALLDVETDLAQFGATVFPSYAAFDLSFAMVWLLGLAFCGHIPTHPRTS